nr:MAG TPA: hypothetical protein [Caudoviricetes sp.]
MRKPFLSPCANCVGLYTKRKSRKTASSVQKDLSVKNTDAL